MFTHDAEQARIAHATRAALAADRTAEVRTAIEPLGTFTLAEAYHQKYYLRQARPIADEYLAIYPNLEDFLSSTAVTRANAYVAGNGTREQLERELADLGLSQQAAESLASGGPR